jgi:uncharacterized protein
VSQPALVDSPSTRRQMWAARRAEMEAGDEKHTPFGTRRRHWPIFKRYLTLAGLAIKAAGLQARGQRNALDIRLVELSLSPEGLPPAFDGYRILHITDPHFDGLPGIDARIVEITRDLKLDLVVLTGDYRWRVHGAFEQVLPAFARLRAALTPRDGIYATLGNHDTVAMAAPLEQLGIALLANETVTLARDGAALQLTGLDDVHYYYTAMARAALREAPPGCRIALVHSPEAVPLAAAAGYALYLCGHTHGGQICLPNGQPILTHSALGWRYAKGLWRCDQMLGYTGNGAGVSGLPVRFFSRGEITLITLRCGVNSRPAER